MGFTGKMASQDSHPAKLRILVVEDHSFLRQLLSETLQGEHEVYAASNFREAWELYLRHEPSVVFLDIQLPDGSGHDLARRIREDQPEAYIIMATASHEVKDMEKANKNLVDGFMIKPFSKSIIVQHINECLKRHVDPKGAV